MPPIASSKNTISTLVAIIILLSPHPAAAMRKAVHWGLVALPIIDALYDIKAGNELLRQQNIANVPTPVHNLYAGIASAHGSFNMKSIDVKVAQKGHTTGTIRTTDQVRIWVDPKEIDEIVQQHVTMTCPHKDVLHASCACPKSIESQKVLNKHRFLAHHEATHIKEGHFLLRHYLLPPIASFIAHSGLTQLGASTATIKSGIAKAITGKLLLHLCDMYAERRADAGVPNQKELLEGGIALFTEWDTKENKQTQTALATSFPMWSLEHLEKRSNQFLSFHRLLRIHQSPLARAQALQKRIDNL